MLFGEFWFDNELCVLFADTNMGKSILAVQIGNSLAGRTCIDPFANETMLHTPVLYVDFELSAKQFETRYTHRDYGSFTFAEEFYRAEFNPAALNPALYANYDECFAAHLESAIRKTEAGC